MRPMLFYDYLCFSFPSLSLSAYVPKMAIAAIK